MNNGVMWFDPRPGQPNSVGPGKRRSPTCFRSSCAMARAAPHSPPAPLEAAASSPPSPRCSPSSPASAWTRPPPPIIPASTSAIPTPSTPTNALPRTCWPPFTPKVPPRRSSTPPSPSTSPAPTSSSTRVACAPASPTPCPLGPPSSPRGRSWCCRPRRPRGMNLRPIGRLRTPFRTITECPRNGRQPQPPPDCAAELDRAYHPGLSSLDSFTHLILLYWLGPQPGDLTLTPPFDPHPERRFRHPRPSPPQPHRPLRRYPARHRERPPHHPQPRLPRRHPPARYQALSAQHRRREPRRLDGLASPPTVLRPDVRRPASRQEKSKFGRHWLMIEGGRSSTVSRWAAPGPFFAVQEIVFCL